MTASGGASAFVDSGAFIAFLHRRDRHHAAVRRLFAAPPARLLTSFLVVSESWSFLLHRWGEDAARRLTALLSDIPSLEILPADAAHHARVLRKLDRLRGNGLTYVDASCLVFMQRRRVATAWACDAHLGLEGAHVVPGPR